MEWVAILKALEYAPDIIGAGIGVAGAIYGVCKSIRAQQWSKIATQLSTAATRSEKLLESVTVAIEMAPANEQTAALKQAVDRLARYTGEHGSEWTDLILQVERLVRDNGLAEQSADLASLVRASDAVELAHRARDRKKGTKLAATALLLVVALCAPLAGCMAPVADRATSEILWPGDGTHPPEIVIEWPIGVKADDLETFEIDDRTLTTAPMPESSP